MVAVRATGLGYMGTLYPLQPFCPSKTSLKLSLFLKNKNTIKDSKVLDKSPKITHLEIGKAGPGAQGGAFDCQVHGLGRVSTLHVSSPVCVGLAP